MFVRTVKLWFAIALLLAMWGLSRVPASESRAWLRPIGAAPGPVRILQFQASVGTLTPGQTATLCYGVENAKSVKTSPVVAGIYPSLSHCVPIGPVHTTHYTLLAEGYDGHVATQSFTLAVQTEPVAPQVLNYASASPRFQTKSTKLIRD
jgi:hypothetical protein